MLLKDFSKPVSRITFRCESGMASRMALISLKTKSKFPFKNSPAEITISISSAPFCTARTASFILISRNVWEEGKPAATEAIDTFDCFKLAYTCATIDG